MTRKPVSIDSSLLGCTLEDIEAIRSDIEAIKTEIIKMKIDWNTDRNELKLAVRNLKIKCGLDNDKGK